MHKKFALLAMIAMIGFVACDKTKKDPTPTPQPEPDPDPVTATITAADVTVNEGETVAINASTNSTATITYASADAAVASVDASGNVTGVKAGSTQITMKVAAVDKKFTAAEKTINVTVNAVEVPPTPSITIDGEFEDWTTLEDGTFTKSVCDPDAPWEGVEEIRCYATAETVYYYIKFNADELAEAFTMEPNDMHLRLCLNTDGEYTSGYESYFLEAYDFIVEGTFADGGQFVDFDGTLHQRTYVAEKDKVTWLELTSGNGLVAGKGSGAEYEISLNRARFNEGANASPDPKPMGDDFQTGIRFYYNGWQEFSNIPNSSLEEEAGNGWGYLMRISLDK